MRFALDTPCTRDLAKRVTRFSGWCLTEAGEPADRMILHVNAAPAAQLARSPRWDLADAFPLFPEAVLGGFVGDLVVPDKVQRGEQVEVALEASFRGHSEILLRQSYRVLDNGPARVARPRSYELECLLDSESMTFATEVLGIRHFHDPGTAPSVAVLETGPTNLYSDGALAVMDAVAPDGVFLDLGCGIRKPEDIRCNGLYLDAVHFRGVDLVSSRARLPLRAESLDAVVSLNVFEHLPDPWAMAAEIFRVLKPGGSAWIETAFMQPMHADPGHFYNMTLEGVQQTFASFTIEKCGVMEHHFPSHSLRMQLNNVLPYMRDGKWKQTFGEVLQQLNADGAGLDTALGPIGRRNLAAGVYVLGRKPG